MRTVSKANETAHEKIRRLAWEISELLNDLDPPIAYIGIQPSNVGKGAVMSSFEVWDGDVISGLFKDWMTERDRGLSRLTGEEAAANCARYAELQQQIEGLEPHSPRDLAMQFIVHTDYFESDRSKAFEQKMVQLAEGGVA